MQHIEVVLGVRRLLAARLGRCGRRVRDCHALRKDTISGHRFKKYFRPKFVGVRSLIGLDPGAVQAEFASFLEGRTLRPNQFEFLQMVIGHLTAHGFMEASRLYEPPYTDLNDRGLEGVFDNADADQIVGIIEEVRRRAAA